ncbi:MAG TPA: alpha-2-macroglobulin [Polyangiales bacterium]|nr:alpha-2-macroglobulin [Polyangiales bacterium]
MARFWQAVRSFVWFVFGRWEPPPWLQFLGRKLRAGFAWSKSHRLAAAGLFAGLLAIAAGGVAGYQWWKNRPKPLITAVLLTAPAVTPIEDKIVPRPLVLDFERSVAPLQKIGQNVESGIESTPKLEGVWKWATDRQLVFTPKSDWPVGQAYEVRLAKKGLLAEQVLLDTYALQFSSAPFEPRIAEAQFYQDPTDSHMKKIVATFGFSHPVDPNTFEQRLALRFVPSNAEDKAFDVKAHVSYDKHKGKGFVHSDPFDLPKNGASVKLTLKPGTRAASGGPAFDKELSDDVRVPGLYDYFHVRRTDAQIVDNARMEPEQVLIVNCTGGVSEPELSKAVSAWLLPVTNPEEPDENDPERPYSWSNPENISPGILKQARKLALTPIEVEREFSEQHSYRFSAPAERYVYVQVKKGVNAFGGYILGSTYQAIVRVPPYPPQLKLLSEGSLLALSGSRKLSVYARDVPGIRFEIARVLPDQLQHWVTQNGGSFANPSFSYAFGPEDVAEYQIETREVHSKPGKPVYESIDLGKYLDGGKRGVFLLKAQGWTPGTDYGAEPEDSRLILVSDLGVIAKRAADGGHDVFVQSIQSGAPVAHAQVQVLGKNGQAVASASTDAQGRASLPSLVELRREKAPALFLVTLGQDAAFLPYEGSDRRLDVSRFDVGGVAETGEAQALAAYLFSDRGVYRPGDELHIGLVVRKRDWSSDFVGIPMQAVVVDPRGMEVKKLNLKLGDDGFEEFSYLTQEAAPTGTYVVNLYTVKDNHPDALLGSTKVQVREFLPDRMTIKAHLSQESPQGWVSPNNLKATVNLANLFGTPAADREVHGRLTLTPGLPSFGALRGYLFYDPLRTREPVSEALPDQKTDAEGAAIFDVPLSRYANASYRLSVFVEGFEAAGGRSVTAEASAFVSPLPFLIGWKADGALGYLNKDAKRAIDLIAVDPQGRKVAAKGLSAVLLERKFVSVLARQDDGRYKYDSVRKETERSRAPLSIAAAGTSFPLPTDQPGDFALLIKSAKDEELQRIEFSVAGFANLARSLEKNAELQLALKTADVTPGGQLELQIKAPYAGAGLITIERDKVYAAQWFRADTSASVQTIAVPPELEGGGYVSVAFIRDPSSDEVFMSPLSHAVVPFSISRARRAIDVQVTGQELIKPGKPYHMKLRADRPGRAVLFAVDEGILRVASYRAPDPLGHFFQKRALTVRTSQILDLILPEYDRLLQAVAAGGDEENAALGANLNPFKRRRDKPVAWWSGLIDVGPEGKELVYDVPDTFNGTLRVMAVVVAPEALGAFDRKVTVRGDIVLTPNIPSFVAPGDEFSISVGVSNNVLGSGKKPEVKLALKTSGQLEVLGATQATLNIGELRESSATFRLKARDELGSATLAFDAALGDKRGKVATDLSIRPAVPLLTNVKAGFVRGDKVDVPVPRTLYVESGVFQAGIAPVPLGLAHGLATYLESFPHSCTEQLISRGVPAVVLGKRPEFGFKTAAANASVNTLIDALRSRQNDDGGFGLWASNPATAEAASVWAMHVLTDARERGYRVPAELLKSGLGYLRTVAQETPDDATGARLRAYAIYVLTRNAVVTSAFASAAQKNLEANQPKTWKKDLAAAYLAATYRLLKQDAQAQSAIGESELGQQHEADYTSYYDALAHDAQLLYLLARHFPERIAALGPPQLDAIVKPIGNGSYNTFSSAFSIMALEAYAGAVQSTDSEPERTISEIVDGAARPLKLGHGLLGIGSFSPKASALRFESKGDIGSYWQLSQSGFDKRLPDKPLSEKLEVFREYLRDGKPVSQVALGDEVTVRLRVRAPTEQTSAVAVVDLLPGGFEVVIQAPPPEPEPEAAPEDSEEEAEYEGEGEGEEPEEEPTAHAALPIALPGSTFAPEYGDVREDRIVLYGSVGPDAVTFEYAIKATNAGKYAVPPVQAESLYDRSVRARGVGSEIRVTEN